MSRQGFGRIGDPIRVQPENRPESWRGSFNQTAPFYQPLKGLAGLAYPPVNDFIEQPPSGNTFQAVSGFGVSHKVAQNLHRRLRVSLSAYSPPTRHFRS